LSRIWQSVFVSLNNVWPWMAISCLSSLNVLHLSNYLSIFKRFWTCSRAPILVLKLVAITPTSTTSLLAGTLGS
jgi:hypothetical protein